MKDEGGRRKAESLRRFKRYPAYKDSGVEWLGEIPAHWEVKRLKTFAAVQLSNVDKKSVEGQEPVRLCNYTDVYYNEHITTNLQFMVATATREQVRRFALQSGDVLITKDSESWTDIAVPAVVSEDLPDVLCGYHLAHIRPADGVVGPFLSRVFSAVGPRDQFQLAANGITRFGLGGDAIRCGVFAMPPEPEQRAIAAFLDRETARIDALVAKKERLIELLQEKRTALITRAVTKGLDPAVPMKDSGVEWLGKIPAHWEVKRIRDLMTLVNGFPFDSEHFARGEGVPLVRIRDLYATETEVNYTGPIVEEAWIETGDVIIGMDGDFNVARWRGPRALLNQRMCCLRAHPGTDTGFVTYLLPFPLKVINDLTYSTTVKHLSSNDVRKIRFGSPPESEQRAIAAFLDRETVRIDALVAKVREAIERLKEYRTALISAAVTGKIDVRDEVTT